MNAGRRLAARVWQADDRYAAAVCTALAVARIAARILA